MRWSSTIKQLCNGYLGIIVAGIFLLHHYTPGVVENEETVMEGVKGRESGVGDSAERVDNVVESDVEDAENGVESNVEDAENGVENGSDYQRILLSKLVHLRESCGELCDLDRPLHPPQRGAIMATTRAKVSRNTSLVTPSRWTVPPSSPLMLSPQRLLQVKNCGQL